MAKSLSAVPTYRKVGHFVEVPVTVVDSGPPEVHGIGDVDTATVQLLFNDQVIASQNFSKFNGTSEGYCYVFFHNPLQTVGLSVNISVTLVDATQLDANGLAVILDNALPADEARTNPNASPAPGDLL